MWLIDEGAVHRSILEMPFLRALLREPLRIGPAGRIPCISREARATG